MRARELGIVVGRGTPGPNNAITDVAGVRVGHTTLVRGAGPLVVGTGPVRTGITVIEPREGSVWTEPAFAGCHRLNGNGELTGLEWIRESGLLTSPIALTNTHSVGIVRDALVAAEIRASAPGRPNWSLPVVGETWDGLLNDVDGMHVRPEDVAAALEAARGGPVAEGNVGGGTGMVCHEFKGGIGTSSRLLPVAGGGFTVGVLVQANYGVRERLTVWGVPVGQEIPLEEVPAPEPPEGPGGGRAPAPGSGSIIAIVATDAPLLPHQCERLAQRVGLGIARMGGVGGHSSGDLFLAFATGNRGLRVEEGDGILTLPLAMLSDERITPLYEAVVDATEEAILNALLAAETMTGRDGVTAHALPRDRLLEVLRAYRRLDG